MHANKNVEGKFSYSIMQENFVELLRNLKALTL